MFTNVCTLFLLHYIGPCLARRISLRFKRVQTTWERQFSVNGMQSNGSEDTSRAASLILNIFLSSWTTQSFPEAYNYVFYFYAHILCVCVFNHIKHMCLDERSRTANGGARKQSRSTVFKRTKNKVFRLHFKYFWKRPENAHDLRSTIFVSRRRHVRAWARAIFTRASRA